MATFYKPKTPVEGYDPQTVFNEQGQPLSNEQYMQQGGTADYSNVQSVPTLIANQPVNQAGSLQGTMTQAAPQQTQSNQFALSQVMSGLEDRYKANNTLMTNRNTALNALYGMPVSKQDLASLDPTLQQVLKSGDKNQIEMQIRLINDQIVGRANTLDQSVQFLSNSYAQQQQQLEQQRQNAIGTVLDFVKTYGSNAKSALTSLYGPQYLDQLKSQGIDIDKFANIASIAQQQAGIGVTAALGNQVGEIMGLPTYDTRSANPTLNRPTRNNNPGNIKASSWSTNLPGVIGVEASAAADGGNFLIFDSPQSGLNAIRALLQQGSSYQNVTAEQAMRKYSGGGYGAEAVGLASATNFQSQIADPAVLDKLVDAIAKREGFQGGASPTTGLNLSTDAIDLAAQQYLLTGTMPSLGLGSSPGVMATRTAILNRAAEIGAGSIPGVNKAQLSTLTSSLKTQQTYLDTIQRSFNTVDANLNILMDAADKVSSYNSPLINEWQRLVQSKVIGSGDLNAYNTALQTVRTEYAQILARGGQVTDAVRSEAARLIPDNINKAQLEQVVGVLKAESENVIKSAQTQVDSIQNQMQGILTGTPSPTTTPTPNSVTPVNQTADDILSQYGVGGSTSSGTQVAAAPSGGWLKTFLNNIGIRW